MQKSVNFLELIGGGRIPEVLIGTWIVMGILIVFGFIARASIAGAADRLVPDEGISIRSVSEMIVEWLDGFVSEVTEMHGSRAMVPFFGCIFMFILFANLLGMIPYSFTFTSHIIVTFALAAVVFIGVTVIGIVRHGFHFLSLFVPQGVPKVLLLLLVPIELLSYFIRPFTLSIRLFANMLAGHTMLAIFGGFAASIGLLAVFPLGIDIMLVALELLVAVLQAYVFAILTCLYLSEAIHLH